MPEALHGLWFGFVEHIGLRNLEIALARLFSFAHQITTDLKAKPWQDADSDRLELFVGPLRVPLTLLECRQDLLDRHVLAHLLPQLIHGR
ncbi:hypothetical protein D3C77_550520 [compost metagenome]